MSSVEYSRPKLVSSAAEILEICRFRVSVWRDETGGISAAFFPDGIWHDAHDDTGLHWAIHCGQGRLAASARLTLHGTIADVDDADDFVRYGVHLPGPIAAPARVVVRRNARNRGLAKQLLVVQEQAAQEAGARYAVRESSPAMTRLLSRRGWKILGPASPDPRFPGVAFQVAVKVFGELDELNAISQ